MPELFKELITHLGPGQRVLDLGAGAGEQALRMAELGCFVVAVDRKAGTVTHPNITWHAETIQNWVEHPTEEKFDVVLIKQVIQFLPKDWVTTTLLPLVTLLLNSGGTIGIATFYQPPEPPFGKELTSLWTANELAALLTDSFSILHKEQMEHTGPDLSGTTRHFYLTQILGQKL